eukprot:TRINITY_DN7408_c0_g2_i1.p1 TRINITY_DN7408_c0_g2~~TRINITY_DN7408_c0_g2_i1.p1  ORF type:complete len:201 (-),score=43.34 TRINITY_DN7408_c0_g2_i1:135-737(-)
MGLADSLELCANKFSQLRSQGGGTPGAMSSVLSELKSAIADVDKASKQVKDKVEDGVKNADSIDPRRLWRSQFLWGDHGMAMAAEQSGHFEEAVKAYKRCVDLITAAAPSSGYELKYRMMLTQCLSRWVHYGIPSNIPAWARGSTNLGAPSAAELKDALRLAEEAHNRHYGGGGRHFVVRMKKRLEETYAALKKLQQLGK